jgi:hypothetical protein
MLTIIQFLHQTIQHLFPPNLHRPALQRPPENQIHTNKRAIHNPARNPRTPHCHPRFRSSQLRPSNHHLLTTHLPPSDSTPHSPKHNPRFPRLRTDPPPLLPQITPSHRRRSNPPCNPNKRPHNLAREFLPLDRILPHRTLPRLPLQKRHSRIPQHGSRPAKQRFRSTNPRLPRSNWRSPRDRNPKHRR